MSTKHRSAVLMTIWAVLVLCQPVSRPQADTATVTGRVVDPGNAIVPGTTITVLNVDTQVVHQTVTNKDGLFIVSGLIPGNYRIEAAKQGFKTVIKPDVALHVQDVVAVNFDMILGSLSESVTVKAGAPLVNTESGAVSTVIDRKFVENLPLNGRSFNTLLQLTPGVVIAPARDVAPGQFSINGQRTNGNYFAVDGVSANFGVNPNLVGQQGAGGTAAFSVFGGTSSLVSVDAVQEFRVQTSSFAPEYGRTPGGQVIIETRSGTNELHGGVFDYFRNDKLDSNNWFNNAVPQSQGGPLHRAEERQNDFGGFLGGPIYRNKTFFFFSYEGLRLRQPQTELIQVPSEYARTSAIAAAAPYLDAYPQPDDRSVMSGIYTSPFTASFSNQVTMNATSLRVDHTFNSNWTLFGRYNEAPSQTLSRTTAPNVVSKSATPTKTATVGLTVLLTPSLTNSFRANYSIQHGNLSDSLDSLGGALPPDPAILLPAPLSPRTSIGFFQSPAGELLIGTTPDIHESQINLVDGVAFSSGRHQMKFGADWRRLDFFLGSSPGLLAAFTFSIQNFANTGAANLIFASRSLGAEMLFNNLSYYGQDAWQMGKRLTLTYGLRWELDPAPSGLNGTKLASWQNVDNPSAISLAPIGTPVWNTSYGNFAPRVGAAYQINRAGDFVLRGGWGLFYDLGTGTVASLANNFPNLGSKFVSGSTQLPLVSATPYIPAISSNPSSTSLLTGFSPSLSLPRSYQWNLALDKSWGGRQALSVTYVGQVGRQLLRQEELTPPSSNPTFSRGSIFALTENGDTSDYEALQLQYRKPLSRRLQALLNYTWSHSIDTGSDDSIDLNSHLVIPGASDRGSSSFDVRHSFSGAATYDLPNLSNNSVFSVITRNWSLDTVALARTGFPFSVTTNKVAIPGLTQPTRADLLPGQPIWLSGPYPGGKKLNFNAFAIPTQPRQGTLGRDGITGFGLTQIDLSIARKFNFTERVGLQFRSDFFNLFNHPNFANPTSSLNTGPTFFGLSGSMLNGALNSASGLGLSPLYQIGGPRSVQLSVKLQF
jgi:hypothetical protein